MTYSIKIQSVQRGARTLLENLNLEFGKNDKIALIGANGTGKTTLFNIINGDLSGIECQKLQLNIPSSRYYHKQELANDKDIQSLFFPMDWEVGEFFHLIYEGKANADDFLRYEESGGPFFEEKFWRFLDISGHDPKRSLATLSGGELMRLHLKRCEFFNSELLLLDEPSNHLDDEGRRILSDFIASYKGCVICISHDRIFMDALFNKVWAIQNNRIETYSGNVSQYFNFLSQKREKDIAKKKQLIQTKKDLEAAIEFKSSLQKKRDQFKEKRSVAKNGRLCQYDVGSGSASFRPNSLTSEMARLKSRANEAIHENNAIQIEKNLNPKLKVTTNAKGAGLVLYGKNIKSFPEQKRSITEFSLHRGEKIWIRGPNGAGKSSLVECLIGERKAFEGELKDISHLRVIKASQLLFESSELLKELNDLSREDYSKVITYFCSWGGDYDSLVLNEALSSGQKVKLWLAFLSVAKFDVIILDEPENHLDIIGRNGLASFLESFDGTLILITHDEQMGKASKAKEFVLF